MSTLADCAALGVPLAVTLGVQLALERGATLKQVMGGTVVYVMLADVRDVEVQDALFHLGFVAYARYGVARWRWTSWSAPFDNMLCDECGQPVVGYVDEMSAHTWTQYCPACWRASGKELR